MNFWVDLHSNQPLIKLDLFDFHVSRLMMDFLQVFYEATKALSRSYYCTSYLFIHHIYQITTQFEKHRDNHLLDTLIVSIEQNF